MSYVFGSTLICADNESASTVAFDKDIALYSVSADGTAYDPSGTLSGGAAPSGSGILVKVAKIKDTEKQLREARSTVEKVRRNEKRDSWKQLARDLEIKEHEVRLMEEQIGGSSAALVSLFLSACRISSNHGSGGNRDRSPSDDFSRGAADSERRQNKADRGYYRVQKT